MKLSTEKFKHIITKCRNKETAMDPNKRSKNNPSYSQCLVTALVARDELGLSIYAEKIGRKGSSTWRYHFFNKDQNNNDVRFCDEQFKGFPPMEKKHERQLNKDRLDIVLDRNPDIRYKYETLKKKFQTEINKILNKTKMD